MTKWHPGLDILPGKTEQEQKELLFDYWQPNRTYLKKTDMICISVLPRWIQELRKDNNNDNEIS